MAYGAITGQKPTIDLSPYATKSELNNYALKTDLNSYATTDSLNNYVKKTDMPSYVLSPQLIVNTLAGASVTAKSGSKTVTGTANSSGVCTLNLNAYGTWNVSDGLQNNNVVVDTVKQYKITVTRKLSEVGTGNYIYINEKGNRKEYSVLKYNYETGLNGSNRTLIMRRRMTSADISNFPDIAWNSSGVNTYANSTLDNWFNNTYKNYLDAKVRSAIGTTKFYYTVGGSNKTVTTLTRSVFVLSATEFGFSNSALINKEGTSLTNAQQLIFDHLGDYSVRTRSPIISNTTENANASRMNKLFTGNCSQVGSNLRPLPAFTLNSMTTGVLDDNSLIFL